MEKGDVTLLDGSASDNDVLNVAMSDDLPLGGNTATITLENIESISLNNSKVGAEFSFAGATVSGLKNIVASGKGITINAAAYDKNGLNISGGAGNDVLAGTSKSDVLTGGEGADSFVVNASKFINLDVISDFSGVAGQKDKIVVSSWAKGTNDVVKYAGDKTTVSDILAELSVPGAVGRAASLTLTAADATVAKGSDATFAVKLPEVGTLNFTLHADAEATSIGSGKIAEAVVAQINNATDKYTATIADPVSSPGTITIQTTAHTDVANTDANTQLSAISGVTAGYNSPINSTVTVKGATDIPSAFKAIGNAVWFEVGNSTYVVVDSNKSGAYDSNDVVVELSGTKLGLDAADFVNAA